MTDAPGTEIAAAEQRIHRVALVLAAAVVLIGALGFRSWAVAGAAALGALLAWINLRWLGEGITAVVLPANTKKIKWLVARYLLRLVLIGSVLYVIIRVSLAGAMGLVAGLSVYVLSMMVEALRSLLRAGKSHAGT